MTARAIWKGLLKIGASEIPVKLYAAVEDRKVHFHVLQSASKSRVKQQMVSNGGKAVSREKIQKGFEVEPGTFVVVADQDLERLKPKESRDITALRFVPPSAISNEWYERPYYLGPDGEEEKYFALVESLRNRDAVGIVRWSMRGKDYIGALTTQDGCLVLIKTRYSEEVLPQSLTAPEGPSLVEKELRMAKELVSALEGEFVPSEFRDDYRDRLMSFLEAKAKGKQQRLPAIKERKSTGSLDDQLARSLATLKRGQEKRIA